MGEKIIWTLDEIRGAYRENLAAYNEMLKPQEKIDSGMKMEGEAFEPDFNSVTLGKELAEGASKIKAAIDSKVITWRRGDPLDSLGEGLRARIEFALKYGV